MVRAASPTSALLTSPLLPRPRALARPHGRTYSSTCWHSHAATRTPSDSHHQTHAVANRSLAWRVHSRTKPVHRTEHARSALGAAATRKGLRGSSSATCASSYPRRRHSPPTTRSRARANEHLRRPSRCFHRGAVVAAPSSRDLNASSRTTTASPAHASPSPHLSTPHLEQQRMTLTRVTNGLAFDHTDIGQAMDSETRRCEVRLRYMYIGDWVTLPIRLRIRYTCCVSPCSAHLSSSIMAHGSSIESIAFIAARFPRGTSRAAAHRNAQAKLAVRFTG